MESFYHVIDLGLANFAEELQVSHQSPIKMKRDRKLTKKQLKFVDAFVKYNNAAKAARLAGYSARVSKQIGYTVRRKPAITKAIFKALQEKLGLND